METKSQYNNLLTDEIMESEAQGDVRKQDESSLEDSDGNVIQLSFTHLALVFLLILWLLLFYWRYTTPKGWALSTSSNRSYGDQAGFPAQRENGENEDKEVVSEIMARCFFPSLITTTSWEGFHFAGHEIRITEATDCYGAVVWPSALVLCHFLESNSKQYNLADKNVIEIGAGTGLVSIVASLLGARVIATDLPNLLGNLQYNVFRNTKMKCKHQPQVKELSWGMALEKNFPRSSNHFDYILAADVVYAHPFLDELLTTFDHLCKDTTIILWVMKFRLDKENKFVDRFQELFDLEEISNFPSLNIKLYKATKKNGRRA